jgi:outer membrane protein assembly factor BamD (BamD/ComL family)
MKYTQITQTYRDDVLAEAMYGREVEYFHYDFDRTNFAKLLETLPPSPYRDDVQQRHDETVDRMATVDAIYAALASQITDFDAHAAAILRTTEKRRNHVPAK